MTPPRVVALCRREASWLLPRYVGSVRVDRSGVHGDVHGDVSLIGLEVLEAVQVTLVASGRNVLVQGVDLNALVGVQFAVGPVLLEGVEMCHPCVGLERRTRPGVLKALAGRGGLRARVVVPGLIVHGDEVRVPESAVGCA